MLAHAGEEESLCASNVQSVGLAERSHLKKFRQKAEKLRLVGISPADQEEQSYTIIENIENQTTFFLKKGDSVLGLHVLDIFSDKVILGDGVDSVELR